MKSIGRAIKFIVVAALALAADAAAQPKPPAGAAPAGKPQAAAPAVRPAAPGAKVARADVKESTVAIVGAKVYTGDGDPLEEAVVIVTGAKVVSVGKGIAPPAGAEVVQAAGMVVTPGLIEPLSQIGLREIDLEPTANDGDEPQLKERIRAGYRAADAYNPLSVVIPVSRAGGITSAAVVPAGGLISGQSAWADLVGDIASDAIVATPLALHVHLEIGADPQGGSRAAAVRSVREAFDDARVFQKNRAAWERNQSRAFAASRLDLEALTESLGGGAAKKGAVKVPVVFHVNRASLILSALAVAKEFDLTPVIAGGAEAWRVRKRLAAEKVPVIVYPLVDGPESFDTLGARDDNAALLHLAGVPVVLSTGETHNARKLRQVAGNAVRAGLPHTAAVAAITRAPAEALGMADRYGTLAAGKIANLVVWSGDPLEIQTRIMSLYIHGKKQALVSRQTQLLQKYRGSAK